MKNRTYLTYLLFSILHLPFSYGQNDFWTPLNGSPGGHIESIERSQVDGTLYAKIQTESVFRSEDDGEHWEYIFNPYNNEDSIDYITMSPNGILYGQRWTSSTVRDVYRSEDKGESWVLVETGSDYFNRIETLDGKTYATRLFSNGTSSIMFSENGGTSWSNFKGPFEGTAVMRVDQFGHFNIRGNSKLVVSLNDGMTWDTIENNLASSYHLFLPSGKYLRLISNFEVINNEPKKVYRFVSGTLGDPNETVLTLNSAIDSTRYALFSTPVLLSNGDIFISLGKNIYVSHDEGVTWDIYQSDVDSKLLIINIPHMGGDKLISLGNGSLHASTDDGLTWFPSYDGMYHSVILQLGLTSNPRTLWASNVTGLFKSLDDGQNWAEVTHNGQSFFGVNQGRFASDNEGNLYTVQENQILISEDGGDNFTEITPPGAVIDSWVGLWPDPPTNMVYLFINHTGLFSTNDKGNTWEILSGLRVDGLVRHPSGQLFGIVSNGPIFRALHVSDDDGKTWQIVNSPIPEQIYFMDIDPTGSIYIHNYSQLYRSDDNGATWIDITPGLNLSDVAINANGDLFVYAANQDILYGGMFRSNNKGENWTILPWIPKFTDNDSYRAQRLSMDEGGYLYASLWNNNAVDLRLIKTSTSTFDGAYIFGNASMSADDDCTTIDPLLPMTDIFIEALGGEIWYTKTDTLMGDYQMFVDTGAYQVTAIPHLPFLWDTCSTAVDLPQNGDTTFVDFSIPAIEECPFITVDLTIPELERCFERNIYIQYCNHGTDVADSVVLFVQLEPVLTLTDTILNWQADPDSIGLYSLTLPGLDINECQTISTPVLVDCNNTQLGETHCITATAWPDSLCVMPSNWSGAEIEADAYCEDSTVVLKLQNVGPAASQPLDFIVVEDDVVLLNGTEDYDPNEDIMFTYPSAGNYYRIESEQEPGHPFPGPVSAWEVGCNGSGDSSLVFIHQYSAGDAFGARDTECAVNSGAYDPNDKQGFPLGFGEDHLIRPMTDIEYLIRFQNTGTAPAHNVFIKDTLSPFFNISSLRVGAASHPLDWSLAGNGEITFTFNNIELPDSNSNEPASHGFVSFRISHKPDLPLGTDFFNSAAIYFDFNEPVITNMTHHQLGDDFLEVVGTAQVFQDENTIRISPNPARHATLIEYEGAASIHLYDLHGRLVFSENISDSKTPYLLERNGLAEGIYFVSLLNENGELTGIDKVVFY